MTPRIDAAAGLLPPGPGWLPQSACAGVVLVAVGFVLFLVARRRRPGR